MTRKKTAEEKANSEPVGRPSLYKDEFADQARKLCLLGSTDKDLADFFCVEEATINNWKLAHPEFFVSIKKGKAQADADVADRLYQRAMGYEHAEVDIRVVNQEIIQTPIRKIYAPDPTAAIFWLKNRQKDKWRDKQDHEISGPNGGPQQHEHKLDITAEEAYRKMIEGR